MFNIRFLQPKHKAHPYQDQIDKLKLKMQTTDNANRLVRMDDEIQRLFDLGWSEMHVEKSRTELPK